MANSEIWLTTAEASLRAGMSRERLVRKAEKGEILGRILGGRWFISEDSLSRFLRETAPA
jgi:hypothetical protein